MKMKKVKYLLICFMLSATLMSCGSESGKTADENTTAVDEIAAVNQDEEVDPGQNIQDPTPDGTLDSQILSNPEVNSSGDVDIDLTSLSATFVYSEVFNMMVSPADYEGKKVKMEGTCNMYQDPDTGKKYYACIVQDATQCCSQGLEFVLDESEYTEDDYPEIGSDITLEGTFATYMENGNQYLTMLNAKLL